MNLDTSKITKEHRTYNPSVQDRYGKKRSRRYSRKVKTQRSVPGITLCAGETTTVTATVTVFTPIPYPQATATDVTEATLTLDGSVPTESTESTTVTEGGSVETQSTEDGTAQSASTSGEGAPQATTTENGGEETTTGSGDGSSNSEGEDPLIVPPPDDNAINPVTGVDPSSGALIDDAKNSSGIIVAWAIGALVLLVAISILIYFCCFGRKRKAQISHITSDSSKPEAALQEIRFSSPAIPPNALKYKSSRFSRAFTNEPDKFWSRMSNENSHFSVNVPPEPNEEETAYRNVANSNFESTKTDTFTSDGSDNIFKSNVTNDTYTGSNPFIYPAFQSPDTRMSIAKSLDNPFLGNYDHSIPVFPQSIMIDNNEPLNKPRQQQEADSNLDERFTSIVTDYENFKQQNRQEMSFMAQPSQNSVYTQTTEPISLLANSTKESYEQSTRAEMSFMAQSNDDIQETQLDTFRAQPNPTAYLDVEDFYPTRNPQFPENPQEYFKHGLFSPETPDKEPIAVNAAVCETPNTPFDTQLVGLVSDYNDQIFDDYENSINESDNFQAPSYNNNILLTAHTQNSNQTDDSKSIKSTTTTSTVQEPTSYTVTRRYSPRLSDEIELLQGDIVTLEQTFTDGWAVGLNISQGRKQCVFPLSVITPITSGPSQNVDKKKAFKDRINQFESKWKGSKTDEISVRAESLRISIASEVTVQ